MLRDGIGTEPDAEQARAYFEASARLGNPHAQYALAKMIIEVGGEPEQIAEAVSWLSKLADSGNQFAQYIRGKLYRATGSSAKSGKRKVMRGMSKYSVIDGGEAYASYYLSLRQMQTRI